MDEEKLQRVKELFQQHENEFLKFERTQVYARPYKQKDLCAFAHLAGKLDCVDDVVTHASHDEITLGFSGIENLTEEDIIYITRCGVMLDNEKECLRMFV